MAEWKSSAPGRKAIGYLPIYVPRELIHAAGMLPVGIFGGGDRLEIIRGDAYVQRYICHIPRSTIALALSGRLEVLGGMWTMLFPGRYGRYVDLPQNYDARAGGEFWRQELTAIREDMERLAGGPITDQNLRNSIRTYNQNRRAIRELYQARSESPWLYPISHVYAALRAGSVPPPEEHTTMVRRYVDMAS